MQSRRKVEWTLPTFRSNKPTVRMDEFMDLLACCIDPQSEGGGFASAKFNWPATGHELHVCESPVAARSGSSGRTACEHPCARTSALRVPARPWRRRRRPARAPRARRTQTAARVAASPQRRSLRTEEPWHARDACDRWEGRFTHAPRRVPLQKKPEHCVSTPAFALGHEGSIREHAVSVWTQRPRWPGCWTQHHAGLCFDGRVGEATPTNICLCTERAKGTQQIQALVRVRKA
eukprot:6192323-Pleurochrysis_carterae.AAC.1